MPTSARRVDFAEGYHVRLRAALYGGVGRLMTLSEGGAYVATPLPLLPQAQLRLAIQIPELDRTVEVEAVVAWENRGRRRPSVQPEGYGLRFIHVSSASGEAIRWLLHKNDPLRRHGPETTRGLSPSEVQRAMEIAEAVVVPSPGSLDTADGSSADASLEPECPPYPLDAAMIQKHVPPSTPGVFIVAYDRTMDARIGRADSDLRAALSKFLEQYAFFHYEAVTARKERFERECELYHRLGGDRGRLDNEEHPLPPPGPQLKCPLCVRATA